MCMTQFFVQCFGYLPPFPVYLETKFIIETEPSCSILQVSPLTNIEKILDCQMRPTTASDADASETGSEPTIVKQYLVKWKGVSYLHCTW